MRLALLADIHGNREALEAVLADIAQRKIDRIVILGDIVGYGPDPEWCADKTMALVAAGAVAVKGNHDSGIADRGEGMNAIARAALDWTRPRLSQTQRDFLAGLPMTASLDDALFVHASANDPADWIYVTSERSAMPGFRVSRARLIFCGHVHVPALFTCDRAGTVRGQKVTTGTPVPLLRSRRWMAVIGSVGQPRDGVPHAAYAIHDGATNEVTFRRVPYDAETTARKTHEAGLPETLALRLLRGS